MLEEIWRKVRRFLILWLCIFVLLVIAAVAVYSGELAAALSGSFAALLSTIITCVIVLAVVVWMIRALF